MHRRVKRNPCGVFADDLLLQRLILGLPCLVVNDGGRGGHPGDNRRVRIVQAPGLHVGFAAEERHHDVRRIVVVHAPAGHEAVHRSASPHVQIRGVVIVLHRRVESNLVQRLADVLGRGLHGVGQCAVHRDFKGNLPVGVSGVRQQLLRRLRVIGKALQIVVVSPNAGGNDAVLPDRVPVVKRRDDRVHVDGRPDGLPNVHVLQELVVLVQRNEDHTHVRSAHHPVGILGLVNALNNGAVLVLQVDQVQFAVLEHQVLGVGVLNHLHDDLLHRGFRSPVFLVVNHRVVVVRNPFRNDVGPGADHRRRIRAESVRHALFVNNGHHRRGKLRQESGVRRAQRNGEVRVVRNLEAFQRLRLLVHHVLPAHDFQRDVRVLVGQDQQPFKAVLHVRSRQRVPVAENHAVHQREFIGQPVLAHLVFRAKAGNHNGFSVLNPGFKQPVENVHGNHVVVRRLRHVHRRDVVFDRRPQQSLLLVRSREAAAKHHRSQNQGRKAQ